MLCEFDVPSRETLVVFIYARDESEMEMKRVKGSRQRHVRRPEHCKDNTIQVQQPLNEANSSRDHVS